ncbi:histone deacetylase complex subunit SAP18-like [Pistacia vera]|uniref:histone deacetylase complex subunit SAP18-like n=1 Tax=Pistacia vera TaxID=55513 RepID=UPI0012635CCC|nr:histone deacetylase complex subunit SAP18-like [Pistacia vera]
MSMASKVKACKAWLVSQPEFSGEMAGVIETRRSPPQSLPREKTLLRIFYKIGGHHSGEDFAVRGKEPKDQFQIYTWKDATLRELTTLIKELGLASTRRDARLSFAFVCPDKNGRFVVREVGRTLPYPYGRRRDYEKTLTELGFEIGNYLDVAIL